MKIRAVPYSFLISIVFWGSCLVLFSANMATAYSILLGWDPVEADDLEGYIIYYSWDSPCPPYDRVGKYPERNIADPFHPMAQINGLDEDVTYYFALTAYDKDGNESNYSNIVSVFNNKAEDIKCSSKKHKPEIRLVSPNGGETIKSGSTYAISWIGSDYVERYLLKYSQNKGEDWKLIESDIIGESYEWQVPIVNDNKKNCLVKVIGYDASDQKVGDDKSDSRFNIKVVTVTSPNGGEILKSGNTYYIKWDTYETVADISITILKYTTNGGEKWKPIDELEGNDQDNYLWSVPVIPKVKDKCMVKVQLKDEMGNKIGSGTSDSFFIIEP